MFSNPVLGPRIVPFQQERLKSDVLPNGRPGFRVTQPFGVSDQYFPGTRHTGTDVANFYCGDDVLAMADGIFLALRDGAGAIGGRVLHPNGWETTVWHLMGTTVVHGARVRRGQRIGRIGSTGIDIGGCHGHVEATDAQGRIVDVWPLLDQNEPAEYRKLNGPGINMRNTEPWGPIYATSAANGIFRAKDGVKLAELSASMKRGKAARDHNGDYWVQLYLNGAYRWVLAVLTTKA